MTIEIDEEKNKSEFCKKKKKKRLTANYTNGQRG